MIINLVYGPEPRSSGGNIPSNPQVPDAYSSSVSIGSVRMCNLLYKHFQCNIVTLFTNTTGCSYRRGCRSLLACLITLPIFLGLNQLPVGRRLMVYGGQKARNSSILAWLGILQPRPRNLLVGTFLFLSK